MHTVWIGLVLGYYLVQYIIFLYNFALLKTNLGFLIPYFNDAKVNEYLGIQENKFHRNELLSSHYFPFVTHTKVTDSYLAES